MMFPIGDLHLPFGTFRCILSCDRPCLLWHLPIDKSAPNFVEVAHFTCGVPADYACILAQALGAWVIGNLLALLRSLGGLNRGTPAGLSVALAVGTSATLWLMLAGSPTRLISHIPILSVITTTSLCSTSLCHDSILLIAGLLKSLFLDQQSVVGHVGLGPGLSFAGAIVGRICMGLLGQPSSGISSTTALALPL